MMQQLGEPIGRVRLTERIEEADLLVLEPRRRIEICGNIDAFVVDVERARAQVGQHVLGLRQVWVGFAETLEDHTKSCGAPAA